MAKKAIAQTAPSHGKPIMLYDASASGSVNYLNLAREFLKRNRKK